MQFFNKITTRITDNFKNYNQLLIKLVIMFKHLKQTKYYENILSIFFNVYMIQ